MKKEKSAAILTVYGISEMTPKGRKAIIDWLKHQISNIQKYHHVKGEAGFSKKYTARYLYK
jgi:hypothetical protein